jgi:HD-GYP domain-containing protein (c-di-GMP phosphodiesterase class II)
MGYNAMQFFKPPQPNILNYPYHSFSLKFKDSELESAYRRSLYAENVKQIRAVFLLFAALYAGFGWLDYHLQVSYLAEFTFIRFAIVVPSLLLVFCLTFWKKLFFEWQQVLLFFSLLIGGVGISMMLVFEPMNLAYYGGLFMVLFSGFFLIRLDFYLSAIAGVLIFFTFFVGTLLSHGMTDVQIQAMSMFYALSILIGMFGSYFIDYYTRRNYLLNHQIEVDKKSLENRVRKQVDEITQSQNATIFALAKLAESRDTDTGEHVARVGQYCRIVAEGLDLSADEQMQMPRHRFISIISSASYLHDIGKVGIEDTILNKPDTLNDKEFNIIKTHTLIGYRTLQVVREKNPENQFIQMGAEIVRSHHERWDGRGYPDGLAGKEIPLAARVMAVVDAYDAMRSRRPYKQPIPHEEAVRQIVQQSGTHFDPLVVHAFLTQVDQLEELSETYQTHRLTI